MGVEQNPHFQSLTDFGFGNCNFTDSKLFDQFLKQLQQASALTRLSLDDLNFKRLSPLSSKLSSLLELQPIQAFELYVSKTSDSKVTISLNNIIDIFESLSNRKMKQIHLELYEVCKKNITKT